MSKVYVPCVDFIKEFCIPHLKMPDGSKPRLFPHQEKFLHMAFTPDENGKLPYDTVTYSAPKKCKLKGERVWLTDGRCLFVEDMVRDDPWEVWSYDLETAKYVQRNAWVTNNGLMDSVTVTLKSGRIVRCSANERWLTFDGPIEASQLTPGAKVALPDHVPPPRSALNPLEDDELVFLALMLGDGCVSGVKCDFTQKSGPTLDWFKSTCDNLGFRYRQRKGNKGYDYGLYSEAKDFTTRLGIQGHNSHTKFVPECVFQCDNKKIALFLNALYSTDGWISTNKIGVVEIGYCSVSKRLIDDVRYLLQRLGIHPVIVTKKTYCGVAYCLTLKTSEECILFLDTIGIRGRPAQSLKARTALTNKTIYRAPWYKKLPRSCWFTLRDECRKQGLSWSKIHPRGYDFAPTTHDPHRNLIRQMCKTLKCEASLPYAHQPLIWDEVKSVIALGDQSTYCVEVPGTETYLSTNVSFNSGKSALGAMVTVWFSHIMSEDFGEVYVCANSREHARGRIYTEVSKLHVLDKRLMSRVDKFNDGQGLIQLSNGTKIQVLSSNYSTIAGANPEFSTFDELWGATDESDRRVWEEMTPSPARLNSLRFVVTYAGYIGESDLLETIYKATVKDEYKCKDVDLPIYINKRSLVYWDHEGRMPWQTEAYRQSQRDQPGMRPAAYQRLHHNEWVSGEEGIDMDHWDQCVSLGEQLKHKVVGLSMFAADQQIGPSPKIQLAVGVDASTVRDYAAVMTVFKKDGKLWLGPYQIWKPSHENPLDLEKTMEAYILTLKQNYALGWCYYDPFQFERSAQTLYQKGIYMQKFNQTLPNLTSATSHFLDLLRYGNLVMYPDQELRQEAGMVSIKETPRGLQMIKDKASKKIDAIVALSMACTAGELLPDMSTFYDQLKVLKLGRRRR